MPKKNAGANQPEPANAPVSFEAAMTELTGLVAKMEAGDLPLEASVIAYQRGAELIQFCTSQLDKVEQQVKVLEAGMLKSFHADNGDEDLA